MATSLTELEPALDIETGKQLSPTDLDDLLVHGLGLFNAEASRPFSVSSMVLDRDPTDVERRALVLFSLLGYLNQEIVKATLEAVVVSNVAGRTDMKSIEWALNKRRNELRDMIDRVMGRLTSVGVFGEVVAAELGETKDMATTWPAGL
jgi:hypothetical protein